MTFLISILITGAVTWLAFSNGANDNFKGVATLYGSGRTSYRTALIWATVTTLAGAFSAVFLAKGLEEKFSGKGLMPDTLVATPSFGLAVAVGAAITVFLATRLGFPVSTTHALVGGLVGAGYAADMSAVKLGALGQSFLLPLLVSPLASLFLTMIVYRFGIALGRATGLTEQSCVCVETESPTIVTPGSIGVVGTSVVNVIAQRAGCTPHPSATLVGISVQQLLDILHFLSAGAVGFARGLNDTPKITALLVTSTLLPRPMAFSLVAVIMAMGGLLGARRVAEKMSHGITTMDESQGFAANLVTSGLALAASFRSLPVSTTHVSVGALFGIGASGGDARRQAVMSILLAWLVTAPLAAALAALTTLILR